MGTCSALRLLLVLVTVQKLER